MVCRSCNAQIQTKVDFSTPNKAHIWAFLLCICGCWPCCLIPYCMDSCKNSVHYCPHCNAYIGTYEPK
ncbi:unnamed protein product [Arctia plantaginis]|uniref:LITAF domain-containing protein n=1 Tax=Arctia plantaginis TaxID=874455 RepID=A0A8S1BID2_ARCPL|nr:unnamed protein product [Arctia plantaginis]